MKVVSLICKIGKSVELSTFPDAAVRQYFEGVVWLTI